MSAIAETSDAVDERSDSYDVEPGVHLNLVKRGSGPFATDGDTVQCNYVGKCKGNEDEFDRNHGGYPFEFTVGEGQVVKGWDVVVKHLKVGDHAIVTLAPEFGYGDAGSEDDVPPGATLVFDLELVGIKERIAGRGQSDRERLAQLREERENAAALAKQKKEAIAAKSGAKTALAEKLANKNKKGGKKEKKSEKIYPI